MAFANLAAAVIGAGAGLYGANETKKASERIADQTDPFELAQANFRTNNPNLYSPFGSVEYTHNRGNPNDPTDDTYNMVSTLSPQMQQLADAMLGVAGRAPATFESNMPTGLRDKMAEVYGSEVPGYNYSPPVDGFKQGFRPFDGEVREGFNTDNYTDTGELLPPDQQTPYEPWTGAPPEAIDPNAPNIVAGETTNREILDQLMNQGLITEGDYNTVLQSFAEGGAGGSAYWSWGRPLEEYLGSISDDAHPNWRAVMERVYRAMDQFNPNESTAPQTEPNTAMYDPRQFDALAQAMVAQGGLQ